MQKAIALRPDFLESYNLLAYISLVTGTEVDETIASLKRVLIEAPEKHNLSYMLGQLYVHKDDFKNARELLEQVVKSNADEEVRRHSESLLKQVKTSQEQMARYQAAKQTRGNCCRCRQPASFKRAARSFGPVARGITSSCRR